MSPSSPSACSSPRINWTRCEGGIAATKEITKIDFFGYKSYEWSKVQLLYNTIIRYGRFFCNPGLVVTVPTVVTVMGSPFTPARRSTAAAAGKVDSNVHGVSSMPCIYLQQQHTKKNKHLIKRPPTIDVLFKVLYCSCGINPAGKHANSITCPHYHHHHFFSLFKKFAEAFIIYVRTQSRTKSALFAIIISKLIEVLLIAKEINNRFFFILSIYWRTARSR